MRVWWVTAAVAVEVRVDISVAAIAGKTHEARLRTEEEELSGAICTSLDRSGFHKVGCGGCTEGCRGGTNNGPRPSPELDGMPVTVATEAECFQKCNDDSTCAAVSLDWSSKKCTLHSAAPVSSACSGNSECEKEHEYDSSSCKQEVCFTKASSFTSAAQMRDIGDGVCARDESHRDMDRGGATNEAITGSTTSYTEPTASYSQGLSAFVSECKSKCSSTDDCRSATAGKRRKCTADGCEDVEYFCELEKFTAMQAVSETYGARADGCRKYCDNPDTSTLTMTCAQCTVTDTKCMVKSVRASKMTVRRGPGLCIDSTGAESSKLQNLDFSSAEACAKECENDSACTGGAYATGGSGSSFCRLYSGDVAAASVHTLGEDVCDACKDGSTGCNCAGSGGVAKGRDPGCATCTGEPLCCDTCISCHEAYDSECFARDFA